jgi:hypothetical protein
VEQRKLLDLADEHVLGDEVQRVELLHPLAVARDDAVVDEVEGAEMLLGGAAQAVLSPLAGVDQGAGGTPARL